MTKTSLLSGLIALTLVGGVASAQPAGRMPADTNRDGVVTRTEVMAKLDARFARLDTNRDGTLTKADRANDPSRAARRAERKARRLARFDTDRDGQLSQTERQAARAQRQAMRAERQATRAQRQVGRTPRDVNRDGVVTRAEFHAKGMQRFARIDVNRDGQLTKAERQAARAERQAIRAQRRGG